MPKVPEGCVLAAIDFSPASARAAAFAGEESELRQVPLVLLHVVHDPGHAPGYYADTKRKKTLRRLEDAARERLDDFVAELQEAHPENVGLAEASTVLITGLPVKRTLELIEASKPVMLVTGSTGRTGLKRLMIGSKAEQLVRLSPVPVCVVR
jgi:nucleotide-binding universal stress UspA family protein